MKNIKTTFYLKTVIICLLAIVATVPVNSQTLLKTEQQRIKSRVDKMMQRAGLSTNPIGLQIQIKKIIKQEKEPEIRRLEEERKIKKILATHANLPTLHFANNPLRVQLNEAKAHKAKYQKDVAHMLARFNRYVAIESQSIDDPDPNAFPITNGQKAIAQLIYGELQGIDGVEVKLSPDYYVYAKLPSNMKREVPSVLFLAHMDVSPEANGKGIKPQTHMYYNGGDIALGNGLVLSPETPAGAHLKQCKGHTIVTSDGTTLLGADDKTGCAILVTMLEKLVETEAKHGDVYICLTQNEDVGKCAMRMDMSYFDRTPDILIDVDGGNPGEYSVSNFTAEGRTYLFKGNLAHPSYGKEQGYADARTAMAYFIGQLPSETHPSHSEGRQGYIHCYDIQQLPNKQDVRLRFRLRYFDKDEGAAFAQYMAKALENTRTAYPEVKIVMEDSTLQYENIAYSMHPMAVKVIQKAAKDMSMPMAPKDLRAGTTASMMVAKGLPGGPSIYSGQNAEHSVYEWCSINDLVQITDLCIEIVAQVGKLK